MRLENCKAKQGPVVRIAGVVDVPYVRIEVEDRVQTLKAKRNRRFDIVRQRRESTRRNAPPGGNAQRTRRRGECVRTDARRVASLDVPVSVLKPNAHPSE